MRTRLPSIAAAALVLAGGIWHLQLWFDRYRDLPSGVEGREVVQIGFPVNAALSLLVAIALVGWGDRLAVLAAGLLLQLGSIAALVDSRTAAVLGWEEAVWDDPAVGILVLESVSATLLLALLVQHLLSLRGQARAASA